MVYDKAYQESYKARMKLIDKELTPRYNSGEALPGETWTEFKNRTLKDELQKVTEEARKVYPAWVKMPNETQEEFRKRLVAVNLNEPPRIPAWKKAPDESDSEFKKRFTSRKLP